MKLSKAVLITQVCIAQITSKYSLMAVCGSQVYIQKYVCHELWLALDL